MPTHGEAHDVSLEMVETQSASPFNEKHKKEEGKDILESIHALSSQHCPNETDLLPGAGEVAQAEQIRDQVEYYFSDKNLAKDNFLIGRMHGHKNAPIPLKTIHDFRKMQRFQPYSAVVEAVSQSKLLDVVMVNGKECIVRKVPYYRPNHGLSKKNRPTGFEVSWTEGPLTPAEHTDNQSLYNPDQRSFVERMESALHRYRAKRKFTPFTANVYTKFLKFGGVDTGQKQFAGGLSSEEIDNCTAEELAEMKAVDFLGEDKNVTGPDEKWSVDFEAVAKGFLSSQVPIYFSPQTQEQVSLIVNVLRNFYNYILLHEVCPEYMSSILGARQICNMAEIELPLTIRAMTLFPGSFNMSCSTLFGGHFKGMYATGQDWYKGFPGAEVDLGLSDDKAKEIFAMAKKVESMNKGDAGLNHHEGTSFLDQHVVETENRIGLEIFQVIPPTPEALLYYNRHAPHLKPVGKLVCKPYEFGTLDEKPEGDISSAFDLCVEYAFLIEEELLGCCFPGMKLDATVHILTDGSKFLDNILGVYCSFYTVLYNEVLKKKPLSKQFCTAR